MRQLAELGPRERQVLGVVCDLAAATASEVRDALPTPPSYSTVRAILTKLEVKGLLRHRHDRNRYVYEPVAAAEAIRRSALRNLVSTFFAGSGKDVMVALLDDGSLDLAPADFEALRELLDRVEADRVEADRVEADRVEADRVEADRVEADRVEADRVEAEERQAEP
jgi:predicted transcriptional regulator